MRVAFRRPAAAELRAAKRWYERQRPGLGEEFADAIDVVIDAIASNPEVYQVVDDTRQVRRGLTRRFPYAIYYLTEASRVVVLAVLHVARDPSVWEQRE